jgi:hypothetical protein
MLRTKQIDRSMSTVRGSGDLIGPPVLHRIAYRR